MYTKLHNVKMVLIRFANQPIPKGTHRFYNLRPARNLDGWFIDAVRLSIGYRNNEMAEPFRWDDDRPVVLDISSRILEGSTRPLRSMLTAGYEEWSPSGEKP